MALLSFRGIGTPNLPAQGEQRLPSFFNIRQDIPRDPFILVRIPNRSGWPVAPIIFWSARIIGDYAGS
jgi:hypothetical protein